MEDSAELQEKIEEKVIEILRSSNMDEITEFQVRKLASEQLGLDLSQPERKMFVRKVVNSYIEELQAQQDKEEEDEQEEEENGIEYDDEGNLIICRLSDKRMVTITEFKGKTLVSIREYYKKDGKELPSAKGISLTTEQWASFKKNVPAIEKAVDSMLNG